MMDLELMQKRIDFITSVKESMVDMDTEGNEIKFFSSKFLVQKYLKLSTQDLDLNDKLKQEEIEDLNLAGDKDNAQDEDMASLDPVIANLTEDQKRGLIKKLKKELILSRD